MIKGIVAAIIGALIIAAIVVGIIWLFASGVFLLLFGFIGDAVIIAAVLFFIMIFVFALIVLFALFYYMAEKPPTIKPGEYKFKAIWDWFEKPLFEKGLYDTKELTLSIKPGSVYYLNYRVNEVGICNMNFL